MASSTFPSWAPSWVSGEAVAVETGPPARHEGATSGMAISLGAGEPDLYDALSASLAEPRPNASARLRGISGAEMGEIEAMFSNGRRSTRRNAVPPNRPLEGSLVAGSAPDRASLSATAWMNLNSNERERYLRDRRVLRDGYIESYNYNQQARTAPPRPPAPSGLPGGTRSGSTRSNATVVGCHHTVQCVDDLVCEMGPSPMEAVRRVLDEATEWRLRQEDEQRWHEQQEERRNRDR